jgi:hypothetical protein
MIGPDLIFSYWIFAWTVLYVAFPQSLPSPLFALDIALIINICEVVYLISKDIPIKRTIQYIVMIFIAKVIPTGIIYYYFNKKTNIYQDITATLILFIIYNIYLFVNNTNIIKINKKIVQSIERGDNDTPFMYIANKIKL